MAYSDKPAGTAVVNPTVPWGPAGEELPGDDSLIAAWYLTEGAGAAMDNIGSLGAAFDGAVSGTEGVDYEWTGEEGGALVLENAGYVVGPTEGSNRDIADGELLLALRLDEDEIDIESGLGRVIAATGPAASIAPNVGCLGVWASKAADGSGTLSAVLTLGGGLYATATVTLGAGLLDAKIIARITWGEGGLALSVAGQTATHASTQGLRIKTNTALTIGSLQGGSGPRAMTLFAFELLNAARSADDAAIVIADGGYLSIRPASPFVEYPTPISLDLDSTTFDMAVRTDAAESAAIAPTLYYRRQGVSAWTAAAMDAATGSTGLPELLRVGTAPSSLTAGAIYECHIAHGTVPQAISTAADYWRTDEPVVYTVQLPGDTLDVAIYADPHATKSILVDSIYYVPGMGQRMVAAQTAIAALNPQPSMIVLLGDDIVNRSSEGEIESLADARLANRLYANRLCTSLGVKRPMVQTAQGNWDGNGLEDPSGVYQARGEWDSLAYTLPNSGAPLTFTDPTEWQGEKTGDAVGGVGPGNTVVEFDCGPTSNIVLNPYFADPAGKTKYGSAGNAVAEPFAPGDRYNQTPADNDGWTLGTSQLAKLSAWASGMSKGVANVFCHAPVGGIDSGAYARGSASSLLREGTEWGDTIDPILSVLAASGVIAICYFGHQHHAQVAKMPGGYYVVFVPSAGALIFPTAGDWGFGSDPLAARHYDDGAHYGWIRARFGTTTADLSVMKMDATTLESTVAYRLALPERNAMSRIGIQVGLGL